MRVIINEPDLGLIRARFRDILPGFGAAHLAEALAAGLGHGSQAALRAWFGTVKREPLAELDMDPAAFARRLASLAGAGREAECRDTLIGVLRRCGVVADSANFLDLFQSANAKMFKKGSPDYGKASARSLREREKVALAARLLDWRMGQTGDIIDFLCGYSEPFGVWMHRRLAAICALHEDLDPEISRFVVACMQLLDDVQIYDGGDGRGYLTDDGGAECDDDEVDRIVAEIEWANFAYRGLRPRIQAYFDKVCRVWDSSVDPWTLEPSWRAWPEERSLSSGTPRYPQVTVALTERAARCRFTFTDAGVSAAEVDRDVALGLTAFALWRSGAPLSHLQEFGRQADAARAGMADLCARWVRLDGLDDSLASRTTLLKTAYPKGAPEDRNEDAREGEAAERTSEEHPAEVRTEPELPPLSSDELRSVLADAPAFLRMLLERGRHPESLHIHGETGRLFLRSVGRLGPEIFDFPASDVVAAVTSLTGHCDTAPRARLSGSEISREMLVHVPGVSENAAARVRMSQRFTAGGGSGLFIRLLPALPAALDRRDTGRLAETRRPTTEQGDKATEDGSTSDLTPAEEGLLGMRRLVWPSYGPGEVARAADKLAALGYFHRQDLPDVGYGRVEYRATWKGMRRLAQRRRAERAQ